MVATLADVARKAKCSNATVSRVINNMGQVSPETREAVLRAMKVLNYIPRPAASAPQANDASPESGLIEVIYFSDEPFERVSMDTAGLQIGPLSEHSAEAKLSTHNRLSNSFYRAIIDGIICEAPQWGFKPAIQIRNDLADPGFLQQLNQKDKAGVLLFGAYGPQLNAFVKACEHPLVLVDLLTESPAPVVTFDNLSGISTAFEHLYALGHRSFGYLGGSQKLIAYQERLAAFRCKMAEKQMSVREDWVYTGSNHMAATSAWVENLLRHEKPSAFLCANDFMAIALMKTGQSRGFSIPRDFSVIGYDDIEPAALASPALSSVRVPTFETGQLAVQQLSLQIKLKSRRARRGAIIRLAPELVLRESTAAPVRPSQLLNVVK